MVEEGKQDHQETGVEFVGNEKCDFKFAYKNLFVIASSFCLIFAAFLSLQNLQSSIHEEAKIGFISLCITYTFFMLSSLLLPPFMISKLGYKYSLLVSMFGYLAFIAAHYYPKLWLMAIGSVLLGISAAVLWASESSYISTLSILYAKHTNQDSDKVLSKFLSLFFIFMNFGMILGNVISSLVLKQKSSTNSTAPVLCGPHFCPGDPTSESVSGQAKPETITTLISIYAAVTLLACFSVLFLTPLKSKYSDTSQNERTKLSAFSIVTSTMRLLKNKEALLLIPASLFNGLLEGYTYGDFTQTYVTCAFGIENVGWVMVCFGITSSIFAFIMSQITKWLDCHKLFLLGLFTSSGALIWCLFYDVANKDQILVYVTSGVLGISNVLIESQLFALYGVHFQKQKEAGFSLLNVFKNFGYAIAFAYGDVLCIKIKIYILISVAVVAIICLLNLTRMYYLQKKRVEPGHTQKNKEPKQEMQSF